MAVGCSHGHLIDDTAAKAVLKFQAQYKPNFSIHLGDYIDTAPFRTGVRGTKDEGVSLESDLRHGVTFIKSYRPDLIFNGNHDIRLWRNQDHYNEIIAHCARSIVKEIKAAIPKKAIFIEPYVNRGLISVYRLGDTNFLHGFMYNENALRDHAEHYGNCVIAHKHTAAQIQGRRMDNPTCWCVGLLGDPMKFEYAYTQRSFSQWSQGFTWGEYCDDECIVNLCKRNNGDEWKLPL